MGRKRVEGVYERPDSRFYWIAYTDPRTENQVRFSSKYVKGIPANLKKADRLYHQKITEANDEENFDIPTGLTIDELLDWATGTIWQGITARRPKYLISTLGRVRIFFGETMAGATQKVLEGVFEYRSEGLGDGLAISTIKHGLTYLSAAYEAAILFRKVQTNPIRTAIKMRPELFPNTKGRDVALNSSQQEIILIQSAGTLHYIIVFALRTGMRQGEILRLPWTDVDFNLMQMRTWSMKGRKKILKERYVPITPQVYRLLMALPRHGETVFAYPPEHPKAGQPLSEDGVVHSPFMKLRDKLSGKYKERFHDYSGPTDPIFSKLTFHGLRHTYISEHANQGSDMNVVQELVGHSTAEMTARYSHLFKHRIASQANQLPQLTGVRYPGANIDTDLSRSLLDTDPIQVEITH